MTTYIDTCTRKTKKEIKWSDNAYQIITLRFRTWTHSEQFIHTAQLHEQLFRQ